MTVKIAIDCMGGDHGPKVTVAAALAFAAEFPTAELKLVGDADRLEGRLRRASPDKAIRDRLSIVHASEVVTMDEPPALALRVAAIATVCGVLAAVAPAQRAAKLDPAQAIRI